MSLVTCDECLGKISDRSTLCPHCGAPNEEYLEEIQKNNFRKKLSNFSYFLFVIPILLIGFISYRYWQNSDQCNPNDVDFIFKIIFSCLMVLNEAFEMPRKFSHYCYIDNSTFISRVTLMFIIISMFFDYFFISDASSKKTEEKRIVKRPRNRNR
jgi:hypothetical protein